MAKVFQSIKAFLCRSKVDKEDEEVVEVEEAPLERQNISTQVGGGGEEEDIRMPPQPIAIWITPPTPQLRKKKKYYLEPFTLDSYTGEVEEESEAEEVVELTQQLDPEIDEATLFAQKLSEALKKVLVDGDGRSVDRQQPEDWSSGDDGDPEEYCAAAEIIRYYEESNRIHKERERANEKATSTLEDVPRSSGRAAREVTEQSDGERPQRPTTLWMPSRPIVGGDHGRWVPRTSPSFRGYPIQGRVMRPSSQPSRFLYSCDYQSHIAGFVQNGTSVRGGLMMARHTFRSRYPHLNY